MNYFVASPDWGVWIIAYFYLGGIAAGAYFLAILIEWFGAEEDRPLARIASGAHQHRLGDADAPVDAQHRPARSAQLLRRAALRLV